MESKIDRDFQTAVSTQSQMCLLLCKIQTKHCIQVHTEKYQPNTAKYQPNTEKVHIQAHTKKHQPKTEKVFKSTSSNFAPISALLVSGEVALNCTYTFTGSISIKHVFRAHEITD